MFLRIFSQTTAFLVCLTLCIFCLIGFVVTGGAQALPSIAYNWPVPAEGSAIDHYFVEVKMNGEPNPELSGQTADSEPIFIINITFGDEYQIRVAGVDTLGRRGEFSQWSDPYSQEVPFPDPPPD